MSKHSPLSSSHSDLLNHLNPSVWLQIPLQSAQSRFTQKRTEQMRQSSCEYPYKDCFSLQSLSSLWFSLKNQAISLCNAAGDLRTANAQIKPLTAPLPTHNNEAKPATRTVTVIALNSNSCCDIKKIMCKVSACNPFDRRCNIFQL